MVGSSEWEVVVMVLAKDTLDLPSVTVDRPCQVVGASDEGSGTSLDVGVIDSVTVVVEEGMLGKESESEGT